ncbi:MAG: PAS domain S-box protein [Labilithrix sp.]|nr:PAS domain S-box protein [Labilithrix sp.]MCW5834519.1 PAS domain S-box protein [Labilithrix sp.]
MSAPKRPDRAPQSAQQSLREVDERFRLLVESVKDYAIFILDRNGVVSTWNSGAERIKGYTADEIIGSHFSRFYPGDAVDAGKCDRDLRIATATGRTESEGWRVRKDGTRFWANAVLTCLRDETGEVIGFAKVTRDLTERRAAEDARVHLAQTNAAREAAERAVEQLGRLQTLSGVLAGASTPAELASVVVEKGAAALRASSATFVLFNGEALEVAAATGLPPEVLRTYRAFSPALAVPSASAFRARRAEWVESAEEFARRYPDSPDYGPPGAAACALPLDIGGRLAGVIAFRFSEPRTFAPAERAFMETFADQVAQALERTEANAREIEGRRRLEALGALAEALSSALETSDVAEVIVDVGRRAASGDTCMLYVLDERTGALELVAHRGSAPEVVERVRRITADSGNPTYALLSTGKGVWIQNEEEYAAFFPALANATLPEPRARALWSLPLVAEGRPVGLLGMGFHEPRAFPRAEREFVETFARQCSEALLRARRLEAEREARTVAETLQASLATTLRSIGDAVIATDARGRVTIMNPIAEALTGWTEEEARGRPLQEIFNIVNEHTREPVTSPVEKVLALGNVVGLANHTVLVHRDGERETPIDDSGAPIRGATGSIDGVVLVFRDVTEKKREESRRLLLEEATRALAESLDYEATLARVAQLAVPLLADWCAVDMLEDGQRTPHRLAVAHVDPAKVEYARQLGQKYPADPKAPRGVPNVLRTGEAELYPTITDELLAASATDAERVRVARELGFRSAMIVPLGARGGTVGAMTFVWAESGHHYTTDDLAFAEELARRCSVAIENARLYAAEQQARNNADVANRAKDEFLAMVSHELRTPLNAIMGWAKMMSSAALDDAKRARAIETIDRNAVAMAQLIEDLLDISRIISGKMRLEVQAVDLSRVVEAAIESVRPAADAKEIQINATLDTSAGSLMGDPTRLQQVVWNLLSNAVKFTPRGGTIGVVVRREASGVEISVSDTGRGIAPRFLPHVFDPFRQEDTSRTLSRGGLGLGLAITRQLVELHGGRIEARSDGEGRGATFLVHLPVAAVTRPLAPRSAGRRQIRLDSSFERPNQLRGVRVLIVDDEDDARQLVQAVLEDCGCRVTTAASVADAMTALSTEVPDLLVSDIGMPHQDGYELIRQVRSLPAASGGSLPAAALTAYARAEDRRRVLHAGYSMHIPKPVEPAELVAVVMSLTRFLHRPTDT